MLQTIISRIELSTGVAMHLQQNYLGRKTFSVNNLQDSGIVLVCVRNTKGKKSYGHVVAYIYKSQQLWSIDSGGKTPPVIAQSYMLQS